MESWQSSTSENNIAGLNSDNAAVINNDYMHEYYATR